MAPTSLIGRGEELGAIDAFLSQVKAGPAALVLSGEPGIGKTILWEASVERAGRVGRVLSCRAVEAEAPLAFAGLSELVAGALDEVTQTLAPPRRHALEVALLLVEPSGQAPDPHAIGLALLDVLRELERRGPVLVAVDDLQWLDVSSAAVLQIALRRVRSERIGVLAAVRKAAEVPVPFELERSFPEGRLAELSLAPLGLDALRRLLAERLGLELARPDVVRVRDASGGNPLFALELGRELVRSGAEIEPGRPLPVPDSLGKLVRARLAELPRETVEILLIAAAAGDPTVETLAAAARSRVHILSALAPAERDGVVEVGRSVRFAHPLFASACYELAPEAQRRAAHQALAHATSDVEERARHLALAAAQPDAGVAASLDAAVERAAARGAPAAAAELSELAAELTPAQEAPEHRRRRLRAAELHSVAGNPGRATMLYEQLLAELPAGVERAAALLGFAGQRQAEPTAFAALIDDALAEAADDHVLSAQILAKRASFAVPYDGAGAGAAYYRAALRHAEQAGDPALLARTLASTGYLETWYLDVTPGLLERGLAIEENLPQPLEFWGSPAAMLAHRLLLWDELDRARSLLMQAEARAAQRGAETDRGWVLFLLADLEWRAGHWQLALDHLAEAKELAELAQDEYLRPVLEYEQAFIWARLGLMDEARAKSEQLLTLFESRSSEVFSIVCAATVGHVELAQGNFDAADRHLRDLPARLLTLGFREPSLPLWSEAIEALIGVRELDQAQAQLERYQELADRASRFARAGAARSRALLAAATGDLDAAFAAFERSLAELDDLYPFERALTLLALGTTLRQAKQKRGAREALEQALALFSELGATPSAEKARAELRRISGRRAATADLTETEQQVARLAADGRANKQIAAALHMSVHTVEAHLTRVYRKLAIHSRSELAGHLPKGAERAAKV